MAMGFGPIESDDFLLEEALSFSAAQFEIDRMPEIKNNIRVTYRACDQLKTNTLCFEWEHFILRHILI